MEFLELYFVALLDEGSSSKGGGRSLPEEKRTARPLQWSHHLPEKVSGLAIDGCALFTGCPWLSYRF